MHSRNEKDALSSQLAKEFIQGCETKDRPSRSISF